MTEWEKGEGYDAGFYRAKELDRANSLDRTGTWHSERFLLGSHALARMAQLEKDGPAVSDERAFWRGVLQALFPREGGW
jgi:hypothetical protein